MTRPLYDLPPGLTLRFAAPRPGGALPLDALSAEERARLEAFGHPDRQLGFALGRTAARSLLAERLGVGPPEAPLAVALDGGLVVEGHPLHLSLAHAGRGPEALAVAALAEDHPVGVDLERVAPRHPDLLRRLLLPEEAPLLDALPLDEHDAPVLLWALKEAVLKGLRTGFRRPARSVRLLSLDDGRGQADLGDHTWALRYGRHGPFWLAVAFPEGGA
ncbi:MAG TPA: 4'-phosphopantetheinyl transferase superfamily protein [Rubricoccaceae bacterium]|nr:4'-phosphopantetheinyl transferase superfamily protein [Rubricoccaceae bacterium]